MVETRSGLSIKFQQASLTTSSGTATRSRRRKRRAQDTTAKPAAVESSSSTAITCAVENHRRKKRHKMADGENVKKRLRMEAMKEIQPIAIGSLAMLASTLSNQAVPRLLGKLLDQESTSGGATCAAVSQSTVSSLAMVVLGGGLASFVRTTMLNRAEDNIASRLRSDVFRALLTDRNLEWFQAGSVEHVQSEEGKVKDSMVNDSAAESAPEQATGMTPGAIGAILNEDVNLVSKSLTVNFASLFRSSCSCMFGTYHMLRLNAGLFGLSFGIVPMIGTAAMVLRKAIKRVTANQRETATLAASFAEERLMHIAMVKMSNREADEVEQYTDLQKECARLGRRVSLANGAFMGFIFAASSGALFLVFNAGGKAVAAGRMTAGELTSFATYSFLLGLGTSGVFKALSEIMQSMVSAERVYGLIDCVTDEKTGKHATANRHDVDVSSVESISLTNVSFSYRTSPSKHVLRDVSLDLKRGVVVALVGKNGSGKSTLASVLAALYQPQSGCITLSPGDVDYNSLDRVVQKKLVQVVPQSPALFNTTILENVKYSNPDASIDAVEAAMKTSNCDSFVSQVEGGLQYQVGQNGCKLSGGQRSRIGLARALLADPALLVLDEPTSSLDVEGETSVSDAVMACRSDNGRKGRALLLITHRAKSLEQADLVVVLRNGEIVETGPLSKLRADTSSELCKLMPDLL